MKTILTLSIPVLLLTAGAGCHRQSKVAKTNVDSSKTQTAVVISQDTMLAPPIDGNVQNYRFMVSFISKGEGIDEKTRETFEKWLQEQQRPLKWETFAWGREGEVDFCLKLDELSTRDQEKFIEQARIFLANKDLVIISENAPCLHKR
jgi:hypothetical protein